MDYLKWYRRVLKLPVENNYKLVSLRPHENLWMLIFEKDHQQKEVLAQKVVLATGRAGFGGVEIPDFVNDLPRQCYSHTADLIDFETFEEKSVGIVGVGASGFDAAATALENNAKRVDMWMRAAEFHLSINLVIYRI